jgi:hypothetical protein
MITAALVTTPAVRPMPQTTASAAVIPPRNGSLPDPAKAEHVAVLL